MLVINVFILLDNYYRDRAQSIEEYRAKRRFKQVQNIIFSTYKDCWIRYTSRFNAGSRIIILGCVFPISSTFRGGD